MDDAGRQAHDHHMNTMNDTTPPADPPPYQQPGNRLTRSTDDKVVGGLAGGLGRWFGIDPVVFRIAFVVLTLAGGSGILLYLIGWLMIPDDAGGAALNRFGNERNSKLVAAVLAGCGLLILLENIGGGDDDVLFGGDGRDVLLGGTAATTSPVGLAAIASRSVAAMTRIRSPTSRMMSTRLRWTGPLWA